MQELPVSLLFAMSAAQALFMTLAVVRVVMLGRLVEQRFAARLFATAFGVMALRRVTGLWSEIVHPGDWLEFFDRFFLPFIIAALIVVGTEALHMVAHERRRSKDAAFQ